MSVSFTKAIVVGASSGIGEAMAKQLAATGATVAVLGRRGDELARVCDGNDKLKPYVHDVEATDEVPALFDKFQDDDSRASRTGLGMALSRKFVEVGGEGGTRGGTTSLRK